MAPPRPKSFWQRNKKEIIILFLGVVVFPTLYFLITNPFHKSEKATIEQNNNNGRIQNIDQQQVINYPNTDSSLILSSGIMYLLNVISYPPNIHTWEYTFGNPDNLIVKNANIVLSNDFGFDTAYFERSLTIENGQFNKNTIRDAFFSVSPDKKKVFFRASYVGSGTTVKIVTQSHGGHITISGVGKLF